MKQLLVLALGVVACSALASRLQAADNTDPTGTWKWSVTFNDQTRESTLKLKLVDGKLEGTVSGGQNNQETKIEDGKFKDGEVSFTVTRERNGNKFVTKYTGKLDGDTIKGKSESERNGKANSRDWEAKREKK